MIYLDHAATTAVAEEVKDAMLPYFCEYYGNPSSLHELGRKSKEAIDEGRKVIADSLGAKEEEIYFTSGGSEADNWVLRYMAETTPKKPCHMISSQIEHHAVLYTLQWLESQGVEVTYLPVDQEGMISVVELQDAIQENTVLISIMFANNEIGSIQPIQEIGRIAYEHQIYFHTDAVQAYGHLPINVNMLHIDFMSVSAHKLNGPKGIGFLYAREGIDLRPMIYGGAQEKGMRAGTENVAEIVGFGEAAKRAITTIKERNRKEMQLRNYLIRRFNREIPYVKINGSFTKRLSNNVNCSFRFVEGAVLLSMLNEVGICVSVASACTSGSAEPSHVLRAIGLSEEMSYSSIRLTVGAENTMEEMKIVVREIKRIVMELRSNSDEYQEFIKKY